MKPICVTMQAFGPYAGRQVLDFRMLGDRALFLIHGPTGSGKTTVLDAMCFALFGECSGDGRPADRVRSDHAAVDVATEVIFDFALGALSYRVRRAPRQSRPKKRGAGQVDMAPEAELWRLGPDGGEPEQRLASKPREVDEEVRRVLGLEVAQFRQVVMLPQGEFRKLLSAGSREREEILSVLFNAQRYARIQQSLRDRAVRLQRDWDVISQERAVLLSQYGRETVAELHGYEAQIGAELTSVTEALPQARSRVAAARQALDTARRDQERLAESARAWEDLAALDAHRAEIVLLDQAVERARQAGPIEPRREARDSADRAATEAAEARDGAALQLADAEEAHAKAAEQLAAETARTPERAALDIRLREVEAVGPAADAHAAAMRTAKAAEFEQQEAAVGVRQADEMLAAAMEELQELEESLTALRATGAQLAAAQEETRRLGELHALHGQLAHWLADSLSSHERLATGLEQIERAHAECEEAQRVVATQRTAWMESQAGALAAALDSGLPCPVCGSCKHPAPAPLHEDAPTREALESAEDQLRCLIEQVSSLEGQAREAEGDVARLAESIVAARAQLGAAAEDTLATLQSARLAADVRLLAATEAVAAIPVAEEKRTALEVSRTAAQDELLTARERAAVAAATLASARRSVEHMAGAVPFDFQDPERLAEAREQISAERERLSQALETAVAAELEASGALAVARGELSTRGEIAESAARSAATAAAALGTALTAAGFADEAELCTAMLTPEAILAGAHKIQAWREQHHAAEERAVRAADDAADAAPADLGACETAQEVAEEVVRELDTRTGTLNATLEDVRHGIARITSAEERLAELELDHQTAARLADAATGNNGHRLTLQRYVLARRLEEVLDVASVRLHEMSRKRYRLRRIDEVKDRRAAGGLDLEVEDTYTGVARPAASLSGGESFLAALALSLGLSDVVQAAAGGLRLDTLFIDEGFGSLDPEALDRAMQALQELQATGRLVGVISHVPEMREHITTRLEVTAGNTGSSARFVVS